jgi:DNA-binding winged helix-turn-helix (wHTH) protein
VSQHHRHEGVVSKENLLQALWGDTCVTENALIRCIAELRKAFEDDAEESRIIQTITKKGYRLIAQVSKLKGPASRYETLEKLGQGAMGEVCRNAFAAREVLHRIPWVRGLALPEPRADVPKVT